MSKSILLVSLLLSGCYLANGSPNETEYWIKNGKKITYTEKKNCLDKAHVSLGSHFVYLLNKFDKDPILFLDNKLDSKEFSDYLKQESKLISKCYYDLGYRFRPPLYWCLAQDGDNTNICLENMKYRN